MMSSGKQQINKNTAFIARFVEICDTAEPAKIQQLLNISYQAAKNYLNGRFPNTEILIRISEITSCSIDWLLTGRGKKFLENNLSPDTPRETGQMETLVRQICVKVINELDVRAGLSQPRIVKLQSSELMSEKLMDEATALTGRQP